MSGRSNTRWGARQPPRRGGGGGSGAGYEQNYDDYNYGQQQYGANATGYEYDQSQGNYERHSGSKRYSSNRNTYDANNYYYHNNPPPRHVKTQHTDNNQNLNPNPNLNANKTTPSTTKKPVKKQETEPSSPIVRKESVEPSSPPLPSPPPVATEPKSIAPVTVEETKLIEEVKPVVETPVVEVPPEENLDQIRQQVTSFFSERLDRWKQRQDLREQNLYAEQHRLNAEQQQAAMSRLDSSIKRIPPFIKRLRTVTEQQRDALSRDMQTLNLTRYISEVATALTEAKLKMSDVWTSVQLCSSLHQRYPDFSMSLYENWLKVLNKETLTENSSKFRVDLRLFAELITVHVLPINPSTQYLMSILNLLIHNDREFTNLSILISFCRLCGEDYAEIFPNKIRKQIIKLDETFETLPTNTFHSNELKQQIKNMLFDYFQRLSVYLLEEHKQVQKQEQLMKRTMEVSVSSQ